MPRPKLDFAQPYYDQATDIKGEWALFFVHTRDEADRLARWLRREGAKARFLELDDRYLLAVKVPA